MGFGLGALVCCGRIFVAWANNLVLYIYKKSWGLVRSNYLLWCDSCSLQVGTWTVI